MRTMPRPPKWLLAARTGNAPPGDWLARALSRAGVLRPDEALAAIDAGRVKVGGRITTKPFTPVTAQTEVSVDGQRVSLETATRVLVMNKPKGVVSATKDDQKVGTVFDVLEAALPPALRGYGWHAVGRLDRDTTGLLLFTNDERFVAHATSPDRHLPKRYVAQVYGEVTKEKLATLARGMTLDDGPTRPAKAEARGEGAVVLTLVEGRHHQAKRMLGAVGLSAHALHREAIGALVLDVPERGLRELTPEEIVTALRFDPHARAGLPEAK